jgi:magnesium transporter
MLRYCFYQKSISDCQPSLPEGCLIDDVVWVDLQAATAEEKALVAAQFQLGSFVEIERRLVRQPNWHAAETGQIVFGLPYSSTRPGRLPEGGVTFILTGRTLITLHHQDLDLMGELIGEGANHSGFYSQPEDLLLDFLEIMLLHFSEKAETINGTISELSRKVFVEPKDQTRSLRRAINLRTVLREIGRVGSVSIALNDHLHWLERIPHFLQVEVGGRFGGERHIRLDGLRQDIMTLIESLVFIQQQTTLVLDATLGIVNLEENFVMRWLTVIATISIPPTLIASVYGMNFAELSSFGGPAALPIALALVVLSGLVPILFFIRRGWL